MTKDDICTILSVRNNTTKSEAMAAVEGIIATLSDAFANGESVYLRGFGTFKVSRSAAKTGRNISTGEAIPIPERNRVSFKACPTLKERMQ